MKKVIWISSSPFARNGFGTQAMVGCRGLGKRGFDVNLIALHRPQESASVVWEMANGNIFQAEGKDDYSEIGAQRLFRIVPHGVENPYGAKMLELILQHEKPDAIITLHDSQNMTFVGQISANLGIPWFHWLPWDNSVWEPEIARFFMEAQCQIVLMSDFTEKLAIENRFPFTAKIYHGVNTQVYKPWADKAGARNTMGGFPEKKFVVGYIGQNEERKHLDILLRGFAAVHKKHPDMFLFLHTDVDEPYPAHWSFKVNQLAKKLDIDEHYRHTPRHTFIQKFTDKTMATLYNCQDMLFSTTSGEGFGLMALYGNACGVPSATTDINTGSQLTGGGEWGWLLKSVTKYEAPGGYIRGMTNDEEVVKALSEAFENRDLLRKKAELARKDSLRYDWNIIGEQWAKLLESRI